MNNDMILDDPVLRGATIEERRDIKEMLALIRQQPRKRDFEPYTEPFRPLNWDEAKSINRNFKPYISGDVNLSHFLVSYQAFYGGFTICNIILNNFRLYSGSSHCIKSDRWLPIRGKMIAFRRALESEGVELPTEKYFVSDGLVYETQQGERETNG